MNKAKLVRIVEDIITDMEAEFEKDLRESLVKELLLTIVHEFHSAYAYLSYDMKPWKKEEMKYVNLQTLKEAVNKALARREK